MEIPEKDISSENWNVQKLRFTLFPHQTYEFDQEWWIKIFGTESESYKFDRRFNRHHYEGEFNDGIMNLDINPMRIDFNYISNKTNSITQMCDLNLGVIDDKFPIFISLIKNFLELNNCPNAQRIAFATTLFIPTESRITGYKLLSKYLSTVDIDPENSSDFIYQINRRRSSSVVEGLLVNRLTKWHVVQYQSALLPSSPGGQQVFSLTDNEYSVNVDMDINSQQDFKSVLDPNAQALLLDEFVNFSIEISEKGDIR
jgi:hypothetical protein